MVSDAHWDCDRTRTIPVDGQPRRVSHHGPVADHPKASRTVDAAAVELGASFACLEDDVVGRGLTNAVHGGVVGDPASRMGMQADDRIERAQLQLVRDNRVAGQPEHFDAHRAPGHRAAGLDRALVIGIALCLLTRREPAVVVAVELDDAPPDLLEGLPEALFTG